MATLVPVPMGSNCLDPDTSARQVRLLIGTELHEQFLGANSLNIGSRCHGIQDILHLLELSALSYGLSLLHSGKVRLCQTRHRFAQSITSPFTFV